MAGNPTPSAPASAPAPASWLSTAQVAEILGCSKSSVKDYARAKKLHARTDPHGDHRFDPAEVHAFANGRREKKKARQQSVTGQIAARVFKLLDKYADADKLDEAKRAIVRLVKIDPADAQRLFEEWLLPFDAAMKKQAEYEEQARRERAEERQAAREATLERERLLAARAGAKADAAMFAGIEASGRRKGKGGNNE